MQYYIYCHFHCFIIGKNVLPQRFCKGQMKQGALKVHQKFQKQFIVKMIIIGNYKLNCDICRNCSIFSLKLI